MERTAPHEKGNPGHRVLTCEGLVNVPSWETVQAPGGRISFPSGVLVEPLSSAGGVTLPRSVFSSSTLLNLILSTSCREIGSRSLSEKPGTTRRDGRNDSLLKSTF